MHSASHPIRILSAALAAVFGLGLVATAGGALRDPRVLPKTETLRVVNLEPVVIRLHPPSVAPGCEQAPRVAL